jgi:tRNA-2-methylthio-N6-dimethylallyladenosine synthase
MKRGYTSEEYRELIYLLRERIAGVSIATDIIVGFPGETEEQFMNTYKLMEDLQLDVAHLARYSTRPGTVAARRLPDDVPEQEKMKRFRMLEELQAGISTRIHQSYRDRVVEVLINERHKKQWKGRTRTNKLVFINSDQNLLGKIVSVRINWTGAWSMRGEIV